jgi:hypothetical protein
MDWNRYFIYNAETGDLIWKERPLSDFTKTSICISWNNRCAGKRAGVMSTKKSGIPKKVMIEFFGKNCGAHRIIWEMHYGEIPDKMVIDHKDGNPWNNRLDNLRLATFAQNTQNSGKKPWNTSGVKGVVFNKKNNNWYSSICVRRKRIHLGSYPTKAMAAVAYAKASLRYHGKFSPIYRKLENNDTP